MPGSFKDLLKQAGLKASEGQPEPETDAETPEQIAYADKVVVRFSRKGRGGKTVTLVSGVVSGREAVLAKLKRELGIGARLEDEELILQGDQRKRARSWLESQGVKKVVVS